MYKNGCRTLGIRSSQHYTQTSNGLLADMEYFTSDIFPNTESSGLLASSSLLTGNMGPSMMVFKITRRGCFLDVEEQDTMRDASYNLRLFQSSNEQGGCWPGMNSAKDSYLQDYMQTPSSLPTPLQKNLILPAGPAQTQNLQSVPLFKVHK